MAFGEHLLESFVEIFIHLKGETLIFAVLDAGVGLSGGNRVRGRARGWGGVRGLKRDIWAWSDVLSVWLRTLEEFLLRVTIFVKISVNIISRWVIDVRSFLASLFPSRADFSRIASVAASGGAEERSLHCFSVLSFVWIARAGIVVFN